MNTTALRAGDLIYSHEQVDELPVGSVICETSREENAWERRDDGYWHGIDRRVGNGPHMAGAFSMDGYNKVLSRPGEAPPPPPQDTLLQFMWKFRSNALSGAAENSVSMDATKKGLRMLGLDIEWELGPGVPFKMLDDTLTLPDGMVVVNATVTDPKHQNYTLWVRRQHRWTTLLGRAGMARDVVIVEYPGVPEPPAWWAEQGNEETAQEVARFKARCWRIGAQIKNEQSWCNTYEHVIARVGVTSRSVREAQGAGGYGVGDRCSQNHAAAMPVGTLFLYRSGQYTNHWAVYQRDETADNLTRTVRIAGHRNEAAPALGHYQHLMTVLSIPVEGMPGWMVDQPQVQMILDLLPIGAVFTYSGTQYIKCQNNQFTDHRPGRGVPQTGVHNSYAFSGSIITINHFEEQQS